jgi:hypothetical protein
MPSERQIAANRRNARRSTGPKSQAGKRRSSANALCHGLSCGIGDSAGAAIDALARRLVGDDADEQILELARRVVRAHLDLLRVREIKRDLTERVYRIGALDPLPRFRSRSAELRYIRYILSHPLDRSLRWPDPVDPLGPMPTAPAARAAEATRRLLPELGKLDRYERRAFSAKQNALRKLADALKFDIPAVRSGDVE